MTAPSSHDPISLLLSKLKGVKRNGRQYMAKCPSHDDKQQSLSINLGADGRVLMKCHAGCDTRTIVAAIGLSMSDLFVGGSKPALRVEPSAKAQGVATRPRLVKSYDYHDADGNLLFQSLRYEPKDFKQRRPTEAGGWDYKLGDLQPVLYRLPELIEAVASEKRIYFVEGEKDADALIENGLCATTSPMGAGKWREHYAPTLAGADVVILPDNDDVGRKHAEQVAASLLAKGCTVRVVALPNLPPKGDVSDWLAAGGDFDDLDDLIDRTPLWHPDPTKKTRWKLSEIVRNESIMRPPPPVVPYLAWSGRSTLLAAREKSGKSTLTGYMAMCVSRGLDFLGEPVERGKVLIVGLEEYIGDTARRLTQFGADEDRVELVTFFLNEPADRPEELRGHIEAVQPSLVVLDSLIAYSEGMLTDANNATQTQMIVSGLTSIAHDTGAALVVIHHARKSDGKYRDSSAIGGAVDMIAEVFPPDEDTDPTLRRVRPKGRLPAREVDFRYTGSGYVLADNTGPVKPPLEQRIVALLRERPGLSGNAVVEALRDNREATLSRIRLMLASGGLLNDGDTRNMRLRVPAFRPGSSLL